MTTRKLGLVREAVTAAGMDISYAYEDLVFLEHTGFLLQFGDNPYEIHIHINAEANEEDLAEAVALLRTKGIPLDLIFRRSGRFRLRKTDDAESIQLEFC